MEYSFDTDRPIYLQIVDLILLRILSGVYLPGDKISSVRDLAKEIKVNPNTLQKAFYELEQMNVIKVQRTNGRFVTDDVTLIENIKINMANNITEDYLNKMLELKFSFNDVESFILENINEKRNK